MLDCSWDFDEDAGALTLRVEQRQVGEGVPDVYEMPLAVAYQGGFGRRRVTLRLTDRVVEQTLPCPQSPTFVRFNEGDAAPGRLVVRQPMWQWRFQLEDDRDPLGRVQAAEQIGLLLEAEAFEEYAELKQNRVRGVLVGAAVEDPVALVRAAATRPLARIGDSPCRTTLYAVLWDPDGRVRAAAARALGEFNDDLAFEMLAARFVQETRDDVLEALLRALAGIENELREKVLRFVLEDPEASDRVRGVALEELAALGRAPALRTALQDARPGNSLVTRSHALRALAELAADHPRAAEALVRHLGDEKPWIRFEAAAALADVKVPSLKALLDRYDDLALPDLRAEVRKVIARQIE